jgi:hypothetical protein
MITQQNEIALLEATRNIAVAAQCLERVGDKHVRTMSRDGARNARKDVAEAILRLQAMERLLTARVEKYSAASIRRCGRYLRS